MLCTRQQQLSDHSSKSAYLKVLQIILLYVVQEIVNLDRTQHCAHCKHCGTISHCTFTVKGSLCVHKYNSNLMGDKNNMELSSKFILQVLFLTSMPVLWMSRDILIFAILQFMQQRIHTIQNIFCNSDDCLKTYSFTLKRMLKRSTAMTEKKLKWNYFLFFLSLCLWFMQNLGRLFLTFLNPCFRNLIAGLQMLKQACSYHY